MKRVLLLAMLTACGTDATSTQATPDAPGATAQVTDVSADVAADTTWSGTVRVHSTIAIAAGVTLTVMPGTTIQIASSASIAVKGTMTVAGAKGSEVAIEGLATDDWGGLSVPSGGAFSMTYGTWTGGDIFVSTSGSFTVHDSRLSHAPGGTDLLTASGGTVDVEYSWLGVATGQPDTTHCDLHFEGGGPFTITVTHSNVSTAVFGVMFYSGTNADFTSDNWFSNSIQVDTTTAVTGDFSNSWFDKNAPSGTGITANNLAASMISDAGPR